MRRKTKILYTEWLFVIASWIIVLYLYYFYSYWGLSEFLRDGPVKQYSTTWYIHLELFLQALVFGVLFNLIEWSVNRTRLQQKSFGFIIVVKSLLYIIALCIAGLIVYALFVVFDLMPVKDELLIRETMNTRFILSLGVYLVISILFINFILLVNRKFGPGNLFRMVLGRYSRPREEKRIFMFLDLKDSTTIAEQLGHERYSHLLRSCFHDLTDIVIRYRAEIYQFVGDEVVLSWDIVQGLKTLNCIKTYFAFEQILERRADYYKNKFGFEPRFRAGMDAGSVTVSEIGDIKREIAYHGDILNTASRILGKCKVLNKKLLISGHLALHLKNLNGFSKEFIGEMQLKGKRVRVKIYSMTLETT